MSTAAEPVVSTRDLRLVAGARVLIDRLSVQVCRGEVWCVLGPNGSGKSTLLHTLAGLHPPAAGSAYLCGRAWSTWTPRAAARKRALLLQSQEDAFSASVAETVAMGRHPHVGPFGWHGMRDRQCVADALQAMDLLALAGRDVRNLSGGERQRTAIATVFAQDPEVYLLDEPSAHLDLAHQARAFSHLARRVREQHRALVFATHDFNLAARFASHALLLDGRGGATCGAADALLDETRLSRLFGFPLARLRSSAAEGFVPCW